MYVCMYVCMYVAPVPLGPLPRKTGSAGEFVTRPIPRLGAGRDSSPVVLPATGMVRASRAASLCRQVWRRRGPLSRGLGLGGTKVPEPARGLGRRPNRAEVRPGRSLGVVLRGEPDAEGRARLLAPWRPYGPPWGGSGTLPVAAFWAAAALGDRARCGLMGLGKLTHQR